MDIGEAAWKKAKDVEDEINIVKCTILADMALRLDNLEQYYRGLDMRTQIFVPRVTKWSPESMR